MTIKFETMRFILLILFLSASLTGKAQEQNHTLTINIEGVEEKEGKNVFIALYDSDDTFLKKPIKTAIALLKNGNASATIKDIKQGTYAVSSFYDKNNNGKMDTNFLGIPKEPTGTSNNAKAYMGPPKYKDAKFELKADKTITINY